MQVKLSHYVITIQLINLIHIFSSIYFREFQINLLNTTIHGVPKLFLVHFILKINSRVNLFRTVYFVQQMFLVGSSPFLHFLVIFCYDFSVFHVSFAAICSMWWNQFWWDINNYTCLKINLVYVINSYLYFIGVHITKFVCITGKDVQFLLIQLLISFSMVNRRFFIVDLYKVLIRSWSNFLIFPFLFNLFIQFVVTLDLRIEYFY